VIKTNSDYRSDIEGLRAIAILLVVLAHVGNTWFDGGFIGVDVFFVISGYLITGLLLKELERTDTVNFFAFYVARLKRLLPALLFMLLTTSLMALAFLSPHEHNPQAISVGYASIWMSNLSFAFSKLNYFDPAADQNMYLHTWSLGVEEQFYLLWPVLVLTFVGAWRWQGGQINLRRLLFSMGGVIVVCLSASIYLTYVQPMLAFYLMPSRAWQFALGAFALLLSTKTIKFIHAGGWLGFISIVVSSLSIDSNMAYPSFWALFPSIGTALMLVAGASGGNSLLSKVLSIKPMLWLGRISYSWYLWHWPILVLGDKLFYQNSAVEKWGLVAVSLLFAIFSYFLIESPIRKSSYFMRRPAITLVAALIVMASTFGLSIAWQESVKGWINSPTQLIFWKVANDLPVTYSMGCDEWYHSSDLKPCVFGDENAEHTAVLIGDSIGAQWSPAIARRYVGKNWKFIVITKSSCAMIDEPYFYPRIGREYTECSIWRKEAVTWIKENKPDVVFMGSTIAKFKKEQWIDGTKRILDNWASVVKNIYIIRATPPLYKNGPYCLSRLEWQLQGLPLWLQIGSDCNSVFNNPYAELVYEWLTEAAKGFDNVSVINMSPVVCPDNQCSALQNGRAVYRDGMHLSRSYVWSIADKLFEKMQPE